MALNLVRNSRVFFSTNVDATTGVLNQGGTTAYTASNTYEIQVLDGFTFSQNVNNEVVTINEAGVNPVRGQRSFNTSLAPVDFSFSTYVRPKKSGSAIVAEEYLLWNALLCNTAVTTATSLGAVTAVTVSTTGVVTLAGSAITGTLPNAGDIIVLSGIATTTPTGTSPNGYDKYLNNAGIVTGTPSTTSVTIQLFDYPGVAITAATLVTAQTVKYTKHAWNESNTSYSQATTGLSDKNQLQKFGMLFLVDNVLYGVDNCALNQASIDFSIDGIATIAWTGQATALRQLSTAVGAGSNSFTGGAAGDVGAAGAFTAKISDAQFITNKLSTVDLKAVKAIGTAITAGEAFTVPITGGNITINNNITYITPANLGIVNKPITYFTGTRSITGSLNAYLKTGTSSESGTLLADMLAEINLGTAGMIEPMFALNIWLGGSGNTVKVALDMSAASITIPAVNVEQVVSTTINFTSQGYIPNATVASTVFDLSKPTDLMVRYYA